MSIINYPKVAFDPNQKVFVSFYINGKRYRLYNGSRAGIDLNPNSFPESKRIEIGKVLAYKIYEKINSGGTITAFKSMDIITGELSDLEYAKRALNKKLSEDYSDKYKMMLKQAFKMLVRASNSEGGIAFKSIESHLDKYSSNTSYNTLRRHLNALLNEAVSQGLKANPLKGLKTRKTKAKLHKPFDNLAEVLDDIKLFNFNLYLCCLLTYGCLLRPHREIRLLKWGDFSDDGKRNKSGRNWIVPVPLFIRELLTSNDKDLNIFSGKTIPHNPSYFSKLWSKYKNKSNILRQNQTLYSFRHSGAIDIFKRTGSITKLQKAMGHSSINVSLTYLRGLEVPELTEGDMPII
jgi:integrase